MIYFDQPTKDALVQRFYDATVPGGYFMISHIPLAGLNPQELLQVNGNIIRLLAAGAACAPVLRDNVIFQTFNLMDPIKFRLKFDVIFCRNVMIYFDQPTKGSCRAFQHPK